MFACLYLLQEEGREQLAACAAQFSPEAEQAGASGVLFSVSALSRLFASGRELLQAIEHTAQELGIQPNIALAPDPDTALFAARMTKGTRLIAPGEEAAFFAPLPLSLFPLDQRLHEILQAWGVRTCGDLTRLPEAALHERLGEEAVRLRRLVAGEQQRILVPAAPPLRFEQSLALEDALTSLDPLGFLLARLLNELCGSLQRQALAASELYLRLDLEGGETHERTIRLPAPSCDRRSLLKLLQLDLEAAPPQAAVNNLSLSARPARPRVLQNGLFLPPSPEPEKLEITLARLAALVGRHNVGRPRLLDTHRPDAFLIEHFTAETEKSEQLPEPALYVALRRFRPPRPARVRQALHRPVYVAAKGVEGPVTFTAGPWRQAGDWWSHQSYWREEWDIALSNGGLYRVYQCLPGLLWFVGGYYD